MVLIISKLRVLISIISIRLLRRGFIKKIIRSRFTKIVQKSLIFKRIIKKISGKKSHHFILTINPEKNPLLIREIISAFYLLSDKPPHPINRGEPGPAYILSLKTEPYSKENPSAMRVRPWERSYSIPR
jgi:hypothetical protein